MNGALYELDGLKKGPINLGACSNENWLDQVRPIIQQRIEQYSDKEIRFTLLALVANRLQAARAQLSALESERASLSDAMQVEGSQDRRAVIDAELVKLQDVIATEEAKVKRYKVCNDHSLAPTPRTTTHPPLLTTARECASSSQLCAVPVQLPQSARGETTAAAPDWTRQEQTGAACSSQEIAWY